jgi:transcriptional antiterminator RfaH
MRADYLREASGSKAMPRWFAAATLPNKEAVALENLSLQGFENFCPLEEVTRRHARKILKLRVPVFRGYVFIRMDAAMVRWRSVNGTRGIRALVTDQHGPVPVRLGVIETLQASTDEAGLLRFVNPLHPGATVRLRAGPLAGELGVIERLEGKERLCVMFEFLGGPVRANVAREAVRRIA